jgi:ribose transport system permease protein
MNIADTGRPSSDAAKQPRRLRLAAMFRSDDIIAAAFPWVMLIVAIAILGVRQPSSLSFRYFENLVSLSLVLILIAFGQSLVTIAAGIDLSVPGVLSVVNALAATQMATPRSGLLVALLCVAFGWLPGVVNGLLIASGKMQPFVVTLATWFIWGGIAFYILPGPGGLIDPYLSSLLQLRIGGLLMTSWLLVALGLFGFWFGRTALGLSIRAIGSDRVCARYSGIAVRRFEILAYALSSWFAVIAALVLSLQSLSGEPTVGNTYVLPMITAVVVGGISLSGGKGSHLGPILGALALSYLTGITFSFRLQPQWNQILQGFLLVLAIAVTTLMPHFRGARGTAADDR